MTNDSNYKKVVVITRTILGYELNSKQNVYFNYLLPSIFGCILYILHFAADAVVVYRHFREENPIWASLTLFFMYCPVIGCFIMVISSWELWPEIDGCGPKNIKWAILKILEHIFFPIWSMWRYAEKLLWSIEAVRAPDEDLREEALEYVTAPRTIEFYFFLQAYLQSIPQIILQVHILMRFALEMDLQTIEVQTMSIIMNLIKVSAITTLYQRFKTQKLGGKNYPWYKAYKSEYCPSLDVTDGVSSMQRALIPQKKKVGIVYATRETATKLRRELESRNETPIPPPGALKRKVSSDLYLLPSGIVEKEEIEDLVDIHSIKNDRIDEVDLVVNRETSVIDGPPRIVFRTEDVIDFPRRIREVKGLPEDDIVGKIIAFFWWFCFFVARILAISSFAYFYPRDIIWLLSVHFIVVVGFLLYDVQAYVVRRTKAVFFIFIGLVYIFCIIEFKKKFKKTKFIYYGFFSLVFVENFVMCFVWWFSNLEDDYIRDDWWFHYMFYTVLGFTLLSVSSMVFYNIINKPKKVVVDEEVVSTR